MLIQGTDEARSAPAGAPAAPLPAAPDGPAAPLPAAADGPAASLPAAPEGPAGVPSRRQWVPDVITTAGGLLCSAVGLTVMAAWFARVTAILRFGSKNPMSFNTALAFVV